ncbi:hypothetical protein ACXO1E_08460 [Lactobacillus delbrueckii subsp. bulgaricus]
MKEESKVLTEKETDQLVSDFFENYESYFDRPGHVTWMCWPSPWLSSISGRAA